ncbi:DUF523 domain-containing protein [Youngiibacter multivorans]|uniref:Uncharacterized protein YbbK (DUF523 family) n=1 Tax=Youngiibacter multivorans TaxID=937251 RepID=A0ABS4G363_9CLOT|nr:DUF523 domain-containing protein [Youngiibacter multivorans]MBP1918785.1 uncharacterized protein YbbK (DUF523 family) [Youngiibacter multivorans]
MEKIVVSACLLGEKVRYDGTGKSVEEIIALSGKYELIPVCPEVLGGLPIPRPKSEIRDGRVFSIDGRDVTLEFKSGAEKVLRLCLESGATKAILKAKSPSCGKGRIYDGTFGGILIEGNGIACDLLLENGIEVYDENDYWRINI